MIGLGATTTNSIIPSILALILFYGYLYYVIRRVLNKRRRKALKTQSCREQQKMDLENKERIYEALEHLTNLVNKLYSTNLKAV